MFLFFFCLLAAAMPAAKLALLDTLIPGHAHYCHALSLHLTRGSVQSTEHHIAYQKYQILELWVNFDHKYCFWANSLELILIILKCDVIPISITVLCYVSPISVRLSVTVLCYVCPISIRLSVTGICNRQTDRKLQRGTELTD